MLCPGLGDNLFLTLQRSNDQITERLDRLISQIKEIQKPYMYGENPADVLLVRSHPHYSIYSISPALPTSANR